jgi:hypothetical protein
MKLYFLIASVATSFTYAQPVIAPNAPSSGYSSQANSALAGFRGNAISASVFQFAQLRFRPHAEYRLLHADGIQFGPGQQEPTSIQTFSPGLLTEVGRHWSVDYTPTWTQFSHRAFRDAFEQAIHVSGEFNSDNWQLLFTGIYTKSDKPLVETAAQTSEENTANNVSVSRTLGTRAALEASFGWTILSRVSFPDVREWNTREALHYQMTPAFDTALSLTTGGTDFSAGADSKFTRPEVSVHWQLADVLSFNVHGGVEMRRAGSRANNASVQTVRTPILGGSLDFAPSKATQFSVGNTRQVAPSYFENLLTKTNNWNATVSRRILGSLVGSVSWMWGRTSYAAVNSGAYGGRSDRFRSFNTRATKTIRDRITVSFVFQATTNHSTTGGYSFSSKQYGVELGIAY